MTHPSISVDTKQFYVSLPSNCGREEVIVGCATLQVLTSSHYMHISKYLRTHIIPAHISPSTYIMYVIQDGEERERKDGEEYVRKEWDIHTNR